MEAERTYFLQPRIDRHKSFYGKAIVTENSAYATLTSYNTDVAIVDKNTNTVKVRGTYSVTTLRHIKEFLTLFGFCAESKKQIEDDYIFSNQMDKRR